MPAVPYPKGTAASHRVYVGVKFDEYTPGVEGQLMRDCMQLQRTAGPDEEVVIVCDSDKVDRTIEALGLRRIPTAKLAKLWILYKTQEFYPEAPSWATTEIQRDMWVRQKDPNILRQVNEEEANGYYLPPQGRLSPDTLSLERPAPNGYIPVDPSLIMVWGPN